MAYGAWMRHWFREFFQSRRSRDEDHTAELDTWKEEIRSYFLFDPISESTRRNRRSLLALSAIVLVVNAQLPVQGLPYFSSSLDGPAQQILMGLGSVGIVYFFITFAISLGNDIFSWRISGATADLRKAVVDLNSVGNLLNRVHEMIRNSQSSSARMAQQVRQLESFLVASETQMTAVADRIGHANRYYLALYRGQIARLVLVDVAIPVFLTVTALWKTIGLIVPVVSRIIGA